jgi:hypothetical protein
MATFLNMKGESMPDYSEHQCQGCGKTKKFRTDQKFCSRPCANRPQPRVELPEEYLIKQNTTLSRQLEKARLDLNVERKMRRNLARNHAGFDDLLGSIKEFTEAMGDFAAPTSPIRRIEPRIHAPLHSDHSEDAVFVISDTHFGDKSTCEDSSGFPEYDIEIAGNRMGYVVDKAKQILAIQRAAFPIDTLYVPILGDIVHGVLHDSPQSNDLLLPAQIHFSYHMLRFAVEDLLQLVDQKIVKKIVLLFSVGNHARLETNQPMPIKLQAQLLPST